MNIIEQLGGYERAKHEFEMIKEMKPIYPDEIETNDRLLLEYRRQHNIYEAGDKVVHIDDPEKQSVMTVLDENDFEVWMSDDCRITRCNLRHATDEEIAAGRRL